MRKNTLMTAVLLGAALLSANLPAAVEETREPVRKTFKQRILLNALAAAQHEWLQRESQANESHVHAIGATIKESLRETVETSLELPALVAVE